MVATSPLTAKVDHWDTAAGGEAAASAPQRDFDFCFSTLTLNLFGVGFFFLFFCIISTATSKEKRSNLKIRFFSLRLFNSSGTLVAAEKQQKEDWKGRVKFC